MSIMERYRKVRPRPTSDLDFGAVSGTKAASELGNSPVFSKEIRDFNDGVSSVSDLSTIGGANLGSPAGLGLQGEWGSGREQGERPSVISHSTRETVYPLSRQHYTRCPVPDEAKMATWEAPPATQQSTVHQSRSFGCSQCRKIKLAQRTHQGKRCGR